MADPVNPFSVAELARIKPFFRHPARKGFPTAAELEAERSGLASFLGTTDYDKQLAEDRQLSKLQLGLAMAQRGFGSMGAQPRPGEMAISTVGRELLSPLAGDAGAVATQLLQQRRAIQAAQRQEDRQLKLAALQQVQTRQGQEYEADLAVTNAARQFLMMAGKKDVTVSDAFTVDGVPVPVIVEKDWRGNIIYRGADKKEIEGNRIGVYKAPKVIKDSVTNVSDIERIVVNPDTKEETYRPVVAERVTSFNSDGSVANTVLRDTTNNQVLHLSGPSINARKEPTEGSKTSLYYAPDRKNIFLNQTFVDAFELPKRMVNAPAELQVSVPKPDVGAGFPELVKVRIGGETYALKDHKDYNSETGNIELDTSKGKVILDSSQLWRLDDPKAFTALPGGELTVGPGNLEAIQKIPGLSGITAGETITAERNPAGTIQLRYGPQTITLTADQAALFQRGPLSDVQEIEAGRTPQEWTKTGDLTVVTADNLVKSIPGLENITPGETIEIRTLPQISGMGAGMDARYFYKGKEVKINRNQLNTGAFRVGDLAETQRLEAGLDTATWTKQDPLRVPPANLEAIQQIPGLEDITINATLQVEKDQLGNTRILRGTQEIALTPEQEGLFVQRALFKVEKLEAELDPAVWAGAEPLRVLPNNLAAIQQIPGLESITANETLEVERDQLGNVRVLRGTQKIDLTPEQEGLFVQRALFEVEEISAGMRLQDLTKVADLTVGDGDLTVLRAIAGLENIGPNETIDIYVTKGDPSKGIPIQREYWYGGTKVDLTPQILQSGVLQSAPLSEVDKVKLGLVQEDHKSYVNTSNVPKLINGVAVGVGQTYNLTKNEYHALVERDPTAGKWLREAGPIDPKAINYTFKDFKSIGTTDYAPGDPISYNPSEYAALPDDVKKAITADPDVKKGILKKNGFQALFKRVAEENRIPHRAPTDAELDSLLVMFPAGMRSGGKNLREEVFGMLKYGIKDDDIRPSSIMHAVNRGNSYRETVEKLFTVAEERYNEAVGRAALPEVPWDSLSFEARRAFADLPKKVSIQNLQGLWEKAQDRLTLEKNKFTSLDSDDVAAYAAATELLILARYLKDTQGLDKTGRFFGFFGSLGANTFADITPVTSGGSQRLQQIINTMKSRYATLAGTEGEGRPSDFRVRLQQDLIPSFNKAEKLNARNLNTMIGRLEASIQSVFTPEILSSTVMPRNFERMAAEAGVTGKIDPTKYRWLDPTLEGPTPVTRTKVMERIGLVPYSFKDAQVLRIGRKLPKAPNNNVEYVKIRNNEDGSIVVKIAGSDGRPKAGAKEITLTKEDWE